MAGYAHLFLVDVVGQGERAGAGEGVEGPAEIPDAPLHHLVLFAAQASTPPLHW